MLASNPLNAPLILSDITLVLDPADDVEAETVQDITLDAYEVRPIGISVTAKKTGSISVTAVSFRFHGFLPYSQSLRKRGKRLGATKAHKLQPTYADDRSLTINVQEAIPCLRAEMLDWPQELYEGEEVDVTLRLRNTGSVPVQDLSLRLNELGWLRTRSQKGMSASESRFFCSLNRPIRISAECHLSGTKSIDTSGGTAIRRGSRSTSNTVRRGSPYSRFAWPRHLQRGRGYGCHERYRHSSHRRCIAGSDSHCKCQAGQERLPSGSAGVWFRVM